VAAAQGVKAAAGVGLAVELGNADFAVVRTPEKPGALASAGR